MTRQIEAIISLLRCKGEQHLTPQLMLVGDTDMTTLGIAPLSSAVTAEIVIAELGECEIADISGSLFESRINSLLHRNDLRFLKIRSVQDASVSTGLSFQDFRKAYRPPQLTFACPRCGADAIAVQESTPSEFRRSGGVLTLLNGLKVRN